MAKETKEKIYRAAMEAFSEDGYEATSIQDIAGRADVRAGNVYYYFTTKQELFFQIVLQSFELMLAAIRGIEDLPIPAAERLQRAVSELVRSSVNHPVPSMVGELNDMKRVLSPESTRRYVELRREYEAVFKDIVQAGIEEGTMDVKHIDAAVFAILGMATSCRRWFRFSGPSSLDEMADFHGGMAVRALAHQQEQNI